VLYNIHDLLLDDTSVTWDMLLIIAFNNVSNIDSMCIIKGFCSYLMVFAVSGVDSYVDAFGASFIK
jgi:hypothetical protein